MFLDPFLNSGVIFASFHSEGTIPFSSDKLNKISSGVLICSTISLSSFDGIPSTPGDLLSFIFLIFFAIISGVTNHSPKCCDLLLDVFCFDDVNKLRDAFLSVVLFRFSFVSSKDSHKKSRDRLIAGRSDSSVALVVRFPFFGLVGVIVFARLCGLPVANCQCMLLSFVFHTAATNVMAHFSCYCSSSECSCKS